MNDAADDNPRAFAHQAAWAAWLDENHACSKGVWVRLAKKGQGEASLTYPQALEVALCFGWIDGIKKNDGPGHWLQRFTPRSARSLWSAVNRDSALRYLADGRMQPAGRAEIERAQRDGRWEAAYEPASRIAVPPDLQAALDADPAADAFFKSLDARNRYAVLFRVHTAKRPDTRARRIAQFTAMLARHEKLHP